MAFQRGAGFLKARTVALLSAGSVAGLVVVALAAVLVLLTTGPGHNLVRNWGVSALEGVVNGEVAVGSVSGMLFRGADIRGIRISDREGRPVIEAERLRVSFSAVDLLRGRYRFSRVTLVRPVLILEQDTTGHWNIDNLFGQETPRDSVVRGPRPLVDLRDVVITGGTLILRERPGPRRDRIRERNFTGLAADMERLRVSDPDSTGISARFRTLATRIDLPEADIRDARGDARLDGDSVRFQLRDVVLPASHMDVAGVVRFGGRHTAIEANVDAREFAFADVRSLVPQLPREGGGSGEARVILPGDGSGTAEVSHGVIRSGRTVAEGRGTIIIGNRGGIALGGVDLALRPLDLALFEQYTDSVPVRGLVRGRFRGHGPTRDLQVNADVVWTDEDVAGGATNELGMTGRLALGGAEQAVFRDVTLRHGDFDLRTIHRFAPPVELGGRLVASGTLDGPWRDAQFRGALDHTDSGRVSSVRGELRLGLRDTTRVDAELTVDSLSFELLRRTYPQIPIREPLRGFASLHGPVTGLAITTALYGNVGTFTAEGTLSAVNGVTTLEAQGIYDSLDIALLADGAPPSALWGHWSATIVVPSESGAVVVGSLRTDLTRGRVAGSALNAGEAAVRLGPERLDVDFARLSFLGGFVNVSGAVGRGQSPSALLAFEARSDTLAYLEPLLRWVQQRMGDSSGARLDGAGSITGRLSGTTDDWALDGDAALSSIDMGGSYARNLRARGVVAREERGYQLLVTGSADSVSTAGLLYSPVGVTLAGRTDSLRIRANAGFLDNSALRATFTTWVDSARYVKADTVEMDLPVNRWRLMRPALAVIDTGVIALDTVELRSTSGAGYLRASGSLPRRGVADFVVIADSVPVTDVSSALQRDTAGMSGAINGELSVIGAAGSPTIEMRAALTDGRFGEYVLPLFQVLARYETQRLTIKGGLWRDSLRIVTVNGSLPVDLALRAVPRRKLPGPLTVTAQSDSVDMAVLDPLIGVVSDLSGSMQLDVRAEGTWEEPSYSGFIDVAGGAMTVPSMGARYTGLDARLTLQQNVMRIARLQVHGGDGVMNMTGTVTFDSAFSGRPQLADTLRFTRFAAFDIEEFGAFTGSGELYLHGPLLGATLTGNARVDEGHLEFADLVQKRIISLDDPEFRALVDSSLARTTDLRPAPHQVFFDSLRISNLLISMGPDVWLRSSEANIQLDGEFVINRTIEDQLPRYRMDGTLRAVRGTYQLVLGFENSLVSISRDFRVTRGTVRFFGTPDFNPELDIAAEHVARTVEGDQLTVRAIIGGTLLQPDLRLESDHRPPLSQTEIVSYLMFGVPPSNTVGNETDLGMAVIGSILVSGIGQALASELGLPVSYLTIQTGQSRTVGSTRTSTARIEAGAQLNERTFLTLNAGLCEVRTSQLVGASLEYRLGSRWTTAAAFEPLVQECGTAASMAGVNSKYQASFDLFWQQGIR